MNVIVIKVIELFENLLRQAKVLIIHFISCKPTFQSFTVSIYTQISKNHTSTDKPKMASHLDPFLDVPAVGRSASPTTDTSDDRVATPSLSESMTTANQPTRKKKGQTQYSFSRPLDHTYPQTAPSSSIY